MPLTQYEKIKILESFLIGENYDHLALELHSFPDELEVNNVRAEYTSKIDMLNKINDYAQTPAGRASIIEIFGHGDHSVAINNKLNENVNTFWANTNNTAGRVITGKKTKHRRKRGSRRSRNKGQKSRRKRKY